MARKGLRRCRSSPRLSPKGRGDMMICIFCCRNATEIPMCPSGLVLCRPICSCFVWNSGGSCRGHECGIAYDLSPKSIST
ncbi:hypothetical protein LINPERPRIM_LOCUS1647 [Linum perenne]